MGCVLFIRRVSTLIALVLFLSFLGLTLDSSAPAWGQNQGHPPIRYVPGEVIVKFKASAVSDGVKKLHESIGGLVKKDGLNPTGVEHIKLPDHITMSEAIEHYRKNPDVEYVQPNYIYSIASTFPNDPSFSELWGLDNLGQTGGTVNANIDAPEAWDITTGSPSVIIAVIDTGVKLDHPDLAGNIWVNSAELDGILGKDDDGNGYQDDTHGWDFVDGDPDPTDLHGHGTHVAGTIAAVGNNSIGLSGVMWSAKIMALRALDANGEGTTEWLAGAILYAADNGARIINASWGGYGDDYALYDAIAYAAGKNALFVAAAGNDALNTEVIPFYPSNFDLPNVIAVAATDDNDELAPFSNYGSTTVDLGAPGASIYSTSLSDTQYEFMDGTSMAAPHVSGVAGLILSVNATLSYQQVKNTILNNVDWKPSLAGKTGRGGRLNAFRALSSIILVNPNEGTVGTEFTITGIHFGSKKGSVLIGGAPVKILEWKDELIRCRVTKALPQDTYHLVIKRKEPKKTPPIVLEFEFTIGGPD